MLLAYERRELEVTILSTAVFGDDGTISMQRNAPWRRVISRCSNTWVPISIMLALRVGSVDHMIRWSGRKYNRHSRAPRIR
jgi:hypothetical protein